MANKLRTILCAIIIGLTAVLASACSFFDSDVDGRQIKSVTSRRNDANNGIIITITYEGDYDPDSFEILDPEPGKKGAGIKEIETKQSEDGAFTILTIYYDDALDHYDEVILPNGTFIIGIDQTVDPETNIVKLSIRFSDPKFDTSFEIAPGKDGKDGDNIENIYTDLDEDGNIVVHIVYTHYDKEKGETVKQERTFTIPKGEKGSGIYSIKLDPSTYDDPSNLHFKIIYEDGFEETVLIPKANGWLYGAGDPGANDGNIGDFYFDTKNIRIYQKETASSWALIADFGGYSTAMHTVFFYIDESNFSRTQVKHGSSFAAEGKELQIPERTGYKFLGWYTEYVDIDAGEELSPNSGHFTDLTIVTGDLKLYALWKKIN